MTPDELGYFQRVVKAGRESDLLPGIDARMKALYDAPQRDHDRMSDLRIKRVYLSNPDERAGMDRAVARQAEEKQNPNLNQQQFFHGTNASLRKGDMIQPGNAVGRTPNFQGYSEGSGYAHAGMSAHLAAIYARNVSDMHGGHGKVYEVEPTGEHENDPNEKSGVRSKAPMRVIRRVPKAEYGG